MWLTDLAAHQVVLTSSLEAPEFKMKGIKYFNTLVQVTSA